MMMAHMNPIPRRSQVKCDGCNDKKDDNDHDDDEKDEENVISYEISSETLTRRGWSRQAKLEQEGRKKSTLSTILCRARLFLLMFFQRYEVNIVNDIVSPIYLSFDILSMIIDCHFNICFT